MTCSIGDRMAGRIVEWKANTVGRRLDDLYCSIGGRMAGRIVEWRANTVGRRLDDL